MMREEDIELARWYNATMRAYGDSDRYVPQKVTKNNTFSYFKMTLMLFVFTIFGASDSNETSFIHKDNSIQYENIK